MRHIWYENQLLSVMHANNILYHIMYIYNYINVIFLYRIKLNGHVCAFVISHHLGNSHPTVQSPSMQEKFGVLSHREKNYLLHMNVLPIFQNSNNAILILATFFITIDFWKMCSSLYSFIFLIYNCNKFIQT